VVELVDTDDSGSCGRNHVGVRVYPIQSSISTQV